MVWSFTIVLTVCEDIPRSLVYPSEGVQKVFRCKNLKSVDTMLLTTGFWSLTKALDRSASLACDEPPLCFLLSIWPLSFTHARVWEGRGPHTHGNAIFWCVYSLTHGSRDYSSKSRQNVSKFHGVMCLIPSTGKFWSILYRNKDDNGYIILTANEIPRHNTLWACPNG